MLVSSVRNSPGSPSSSTLFESISRAHLNALSGSVDADERFSSSAERQRWNVAAFGSAGIFTVSASRLFDPATTFAMCSATAAASDVAWLRRSSSPSASSVCPAESGSSGGPSPPPPGGLLPESSESESSEESPSSPWPGCRCLRLPPGAPPPPEGSVVPRGGGLSFAFVVCPLARRLSRRTDRHCERLHRSADR